MYVTVISFVLYCLFVLSILASKGINSCVYTCVCGCPLVIGLFKCCLDLLIVIAKYNVFDR